MEKVALAEINQLDIVSFLKTIKIHPVEILGHHYWYRSPFNEYISETPFFRIDRKANRWWDFYTGEGSTLVDFGVKYFNCTIAELFQHFARAYSYVPHLNRKPPDDRKPTVGIIKTHPIISDHLIRHLWEIRIPLNVAQRYCIEAQVTLNSKPYYALGFSTDNGGYELRTSRQQYRTGPLSSTLISNHSANLAVFEDFFDLLTFVTFTSIPSAGLPDLLVLNSIVLFQSSLPVIERYKQKHLFLKNSVVSNQYRHTMLAHGNSYTDHQPLYAGYYDLHQWACNIGKATIPEAEKTP